MRYSPTLAAGLGRSSQTFPRARLVRRSIENRQAAALPPLPRIAGASYEQISLPDNVLTVGKTARIDAEVTAKVVIVLGQLVGNVTVKDKFELLAGGSMQGNVKAPRIAMADGATFNGKVEMPGGKPAPAVVQAPAQKPEMVAV